MKKSILVLTMALAASLAASAQSDRELSNNSAAADAKVVHRLFQKIFQPSCAALPQLAICDFKLQNEILIVHSNTADQAKFTMTTLSSVSTELAAQDLSARYQFDHATALQSAAVLEAWIKRMQSNENITSRAEFEAVYSSTLGISLQDIIQLSETNDHKRLDEVSSAIARKFNTSSRDAKLFLEALVANEPAR